jgi:amidase
MPDPATFRLEEATIDELHEAIKAGRTTCVAVVRQYLDRARAFNGVASVLVTEDGAPVAEAHGTVRGMAPLRFPTETVSVAKIFPISTSIRDRRSNWGAWSRRLPIPRYSSNTG